MIRSIPIILFLAFCCSCKVHIPPKKLNIDGVMLTCPQGWKITDAENFNDLGYLITFEKAGLIESGIVVLTWLNHEGDLEETMSTYIYEMQNTFPYKKAGLTFTATTKSTFGNFECDEKSFITKILGVAHEGAIQVFNKSGKTFTILTQTATEDKQKNILGFKIIEDSFKIVESL